MGKRNSYLIQRSRVLAKACWISADKGSKNEGMRISSGAHMLPPTLPAISDPTLHTSGVSASAAPTTTSAVSAAVQSQPLPSTSSFPLTSEFHSVKRSKILKSDKDTSFTGDSFSFSGTASGNGRHNTLLKKKCKKVISFTLTTGSGELRDLSANPPQKLPIFRLLPSGLRIPTRCP